MDPKTDKIFVESWLGVRVGSPSVSELWRGVSLRQAAFIDDKTGAVAIAWCLMLSSSSEVHSKPYDTPRLKAQTGDKRDYPTFLRLFSMILIINRL
ncbi:hypothetical protein RRG08_011858 [Elysia crispata]|uniref:Uncharacterized protein n=1 Tax=Elysia crispata TaxID=231223 RepID=A0AAE1DJC7_9GAST|nr:hypothetical protein RRG08_011858 [Elysia crispata]